LGGLHQIDEDGSMATLSNAGPSWPADMDPLKPGFRAAFISHTALLGGAEKALLELIEGLKSKGMDCFVVMPSAGPLEQALQRLDVPYAIVKYSWWSNPVNRLRRNCNNVLAIFQLARVLKREKIDVVCSNTVTIPSGAFAAKLCGLPHIWLIKEFGKEDHGLEFDIGEKLAMRLIDLLSRTVVCNSHAVLAKFAQHIPKAKLTMIYTGIADSFEGGSARPSARRSPRAICVLVGAVRPSKGQEEAIEAINLLAKEGLDVGLAIVGSGAPEYEAHLRELIAARHLDDRVELVGHVDNPSAYVESADIVLICSRREAFGRAPLEGMAMGKPIVGSRSGGTVEMVRDHFNGLLYAPGDARDLANQIKHLAENPEYARKLGEKGREWGKQAFTAEQTVTDTLSVIRKAVAKVALA
jgi:glycosyltransferase involved in cell wall biosynthesis